MIAAAPGQPGRDRLLPLAGAPWSTTIAPVLALLTMAFGVILALSRFDLLSGADSRVINHLPVLIGVAFAAGAGNVLWLKCVRTVRYRIVTDHLSVGAIRELMISTFT
jgi:hypothetical protein